MDICEFADNLVLEFKDNDVKRNIFVYSTGEKDNFRVVKGISAKNQQFITSYCNREDLKGIWIDSVVNGYIVVSNKVFPKGAKDCLPPKRLDIVVNGNIPVDYEGDKIKVIYEGLCETGVLGDLPLT